jgi:hypothetical protein
VTFPRTHKGGACPVHEGAIVRIHLRCQERMSEREYEAGKLNWKHANGPGDIVSFLFVSGPEEE